MRVPPRRVASSVPSGPCRPAHHAGQDEAVGPLLRPGPPEMANVAELSTGSRAPAGPLAHNARTVSSFPGVGAGDPHSLTGSPTHRNRLVRSPHRLCVCIWPKPRRYRPPSRCRASALCGLGGPLRHGGSPSVIECLGYQGSSCRSGLLTGKLRGLVGQESPAARPIRRQ
jgi:hypothetical protein